MPQDGSYTIPPLQNLYPVVLPVCYEDSVDRVSVHSFRTVELVHPVPFLAVFLGVELELGLRLFKYLHAITFKDNEYVSGRVSGGMNNREPRVMGFLVA